MVGEVAQIVWTNELFSGQEHQPTNDWTVEQKKVNRMSSNRCYESELCLSVELSI